MIPRAGGDTRDAAIRPPQERASYQRLMSFTCRHEYYGGGRFTDFEITATAPTQTLLRNLGLVARPRRGGVDILYDTVKSAAIVRYLWESRERRAQRHERQQQQRQQQQQEQQQPQQEQQQPQHEQQQPQRRPQSDLDFDARTPALDLLGTHYGSWSRLTFLLRPRDALFSNFTEMPLDKPLGGYALQISNQFAEQPPGDPVRLEVNWRERLLPVLAGEFAPSFLHFPTSQNAQHFILHDTTGCAILHADPDYRPPAEPKAEVPRRMRLVPGKDVHVDMACELPGSFSYSILHTYRSGEPERGGSFFYPGTKLVPLFFVDLFLASPEKPGWSQGCYPITLPHEVKDAATAPIVARDYEICFAARKTIWIYYIVLSSEEAASKGLRIRAEPESGLEFAGPLPSDIPLPGGRKAYCFIATKAQPLQQRSDVALRLLGGAGVGNGSDRILLERLPTPSAERITTPPPPWPLTVHPTVASEVFVHL